MTFRLDDHATSKLLDTLGVPASWHRRATLPDPARVVAHLVPRARIVTHAEMGAALAQVREDVMGIFDLALIELEASVIYRSEAEMLHVAGALLGLDDIPSALAVLRGWTNNPWSKK